jgi:autotransporter-associated beta strand protein
MKTPILPKRPAALLGALLTCLALSLHAANTTYNYDGPNAGGNGDNNSDGGSGVWDTSTLNWDVGTGLKVAWPATGVNASAYFGGSAGTVTVSAVTASNLVFATSGYTLTNGTLTLFGGNSTINGNSTTNYTVLAGVPTKISMYGSLVLCAPNTFALSSYMNITAGCYLTAGATETPGTSGPFGKSGQIFFGGGVLQYSSANSYDYSSRFYPNFNQPINIDPNGQSVTFAAALPTQTGASSLTVTNSTGTGTLTLAGVNTFTGPITNYASATLTIGNGTTGSLGSGNYPGAITNSGTLNFNLSSTANQTLAGVISGPGTLTLSGPGAVTLSSNNTYSGATIINNGRLVGVAGGSCSNSAISVAATSGNTAALGISVADITKQWTCPSLTVNNAGTASTLDFNFGRFLPSTTLAPLNIAGAATFTTTPTVTVEVTNALPVNAQYPLMTWTSTSGTPPSSVTINALRPMTGSLSVSNSTLYLTITGNNEPLKWAGGAAGNWNKISGWLDSSTPTPQSQSYMDYDWVMFDDSAATSPTITLTNTVTPSAVTANNSTYNYTISGTGTIAGNTGLTKSGSGTLTLLNPNTFTGLITINSGTLTVGSGGNLGGGSYNGAIVNNGSFIYNSTVLNLNGVISGSGTLTAQSGTLSLLAANTYSGSTTISGSGAQISVTSLNNISSPNPSSSLGRPTTVADGTISINGGVLSFNGGAETTDRVINLAGASGATIQHSLAGPLKFTSAFTATGSGAKKLTLQGASPGSDEITGAIVDGSGTTHITKADTGTWTLSGPNTYTGTNAIAGGYLVAGAAENAGVSGPFGTRTTAGAIFFSGGTLQYSAANQYDYSGRFSTANNQPIKIDPKGQSVTFATALTSSGGSLTLTNSTGTGTLTLSATNTFTGSITNFSGILTMGGSGSLGSGNYSGTITNTGTLNFNSTANQILAGIISGPGALTLSGSGTVTLTNLNTYSGPTTINNGKLVGAANGTGSSANSPVSVATATLGVSVATAGNQWTCASLATGTGSSLDFNFGTLVPSAATAPLRINSVANFNTTPTVTVYLGNTAIANGQYPLMTWASSSGTPPSSVTINGLRYTGSLSTNNNTLYLTITGNKEPLTWATSGNGNWSDINAWNDATPSPATYADPDLVVLDDTSTGGHTITLTSTVNPTAVAVNNSTGNNYTLSGNYGIAGSTGISKSGTGALTLATTNTYTGTTAINGGILNAGATETAGVSGPFGKTTTAGAIAFGGGTLQYSSLNANDYSGRFSTAGQPISIDVNGRSVTFATALAGASGSLTLGDSIGTGTLTLSTAPTYNGATTINSGTLALTAANNAMSGPITINSLGTLTVGNNSSVTLGGGTYSQNITDNGALNWFSTATSQTLSGIISGSGNLTNSAGTLILSGANTYSGTTTLKAGTVRASAPQTGTTSGPLGANGNINFAGGTLQFTNATAAWDPSPRIAGGTSASQIIIDTFSQNITFGTGLTASQSAGLRLNDSATTKGSLTLTGANAYTGNTFVNTGTTLAIGGSGSLGNGSLSGALTINGTFIYNSSAAQTLAGIIAGSGALIKSGAGTLTLVGSDSFTGSTTVNGGELVGVTGSQNMGTAVAVTNGATLGTKVITSGGQVGWKSATFGASASDTGTAHFDFSGFAPSATTAPLVVANGVTNKGTLNVVISGAFAVGTYPLIKVTNSASGLVVGALGTVTLPAGATGNLSSDTTTVYVTVKATPVLSGLVSKTITYGTASVTLSGALSGASGSGAVYPLFGDTVSASINGHLVNGTVTNSTGGFSINYNDPSLATNGVGASPYTITYAYAGNSGLFLNAAPNDMTTTLTVTTAALTVQANDDTKDYGAGKSYGSGSTAFTTPVPPQNGETIGTVTLTASGGTAATDAPGSYALTPSAATGGTVNTNNYTITYQTGTLTVNKAALTIKANDDTKIYGTTNTYGPGSTAFTMPVPPQNGETIGSITLTASGGAAATDAAGNYTLTPSAATGGTVNTNNYIITYATGTLTVNKAALTIKANDDTKTYGTTNTYGPGSTAFTTPVPPQNGETIGTVTITASGGTNATDAPGTYMLTPSDAAGGTANTNNYTITYATGTLTVNAAPTTNVLASTPNPSPTGSNVTFTATVSPVAPSAGTPTGTVEFRTNDVAFDSAPLVSGVATVTNNVLPHGSNIVTAAYPGDSNFIGSTNTLVQVVNTDPSAQDFEMGAVSGQPTTLQIIDGKFAPTDPDNDPLIVTQVTPSGGDTVSTDGTNVTYTSAIGFAGTNTFTYTVSDNYGATAVATVTVIVSPDASFNRLGLPVILPNGDVQLSFLGIPGYNYALDWTHSLNAPVEWSPVITNTAASNGQLSFTNTPSGGNDYYRTRYVP